MMMSLTKPTGNDGDDMKMTLNLVWFVLQRVKEYLVGSSLVCKLQAKHDQLKMAVEKGITSAFLTEQYQRANCWPNVSFETIGALQNIIFH